MHGMHTMHASKIGTLETYKTSDDDDPIIHQGVYILL
jgi:hypothetical protein